MTHDSTAATAAAPAAGHRPPLTRPREGRMVFGVCAALGRYTDIDPVIYRVVLVALTIFGGLGAVLYGVGWLLIPEEGHSHSVLDRVTRHNFRRLRTPVGAIIAVVALVLLIEATAGGPRNTAVTILLLALVAYLFLHNRGGRHGGGYGGTPGGGYDGGSDQPPAPTPPTGSGMAASSAATSVLDEPTTAPASDPGAPTSTAWTPLPTPPPPPPLPFVPRAPKPPRSRLGLLAFSAALLVMGVLTAVRQAGANSISVAVILASGLGVLAIGLVVGTWYGRARWLVVPGVLLAIASCVAASINVPLTGGMGERLWQPQSATDLKSSYHLGIGHGTLDLTDLAVLQSSESDLQSFGTINASVGIGELDVIVPKGVPVHIHAQADAGDLEVFNREQNGLSPDLTVTQPPLSGSDVLNLDLAVSLGHVQVTRG